MEELAALAVYALIGMCAEVVALSLEQVSGQTLAAVAVEVGECGSHCGSGHARCDSETADASPARLALLDDLCEIGVKEQVCQLGIIDVSLLILPRNTLRMMQPPRHMSAMPP